MICFCGAWTSVRATRGAVRFRECANKHRWKTVEVAEFEIVPSELVAMKRKRAGLREGTFAGAAATRTPIAVQLEILAALDRGLTHAQVAAELKVSTKTIQKVKLRRIDIQKEATLP